MFLRALYDFAQERRLLDGLPVQDRSIHFYLPINAEGELVGSGAIPLFQKDERGKEWLGLALPMPGFPGENNGGKSHFLAESSVCVFGRVKETGDSIRVTTPGSDPRSDTIKKFEKEDILRYKSFLNFWEQIKDAATATQAASLSALLKFKQRYLHETNGLIQADIPWLESRANRNGKLEFGIRTATGGWEKLKNAVLTFQVNDKPLFEGSDRNHTLTRYWFELYPKLAFTDVDDEVKADGPSRKCFCILSEQTDVPVARSHNPPIKQVPNMSPKGGRIVSFAQDSPAFSSYGFEMGENCSISETAAASYALALNYLLERDEHSLRIGGSKGDLKVCFWAKQNQQAMSFIVRLLTKPQPVEVWQFLLTPFSGISRDSMRLDRFYSATLTGNKGRVVVKHWLEEPLDKVAENFQKWFLDLELVAFSRFTPPESTFPNLEALCAATIRDTKDLVPDVPAQLYRAALESTSVSISLIKRVLHRLEADLMKFGDGILETPLPGKTLDAIRKSGQPFPPSGQARFALLKLILNRNPHKSMEQKPQLVADTSDIAYNCGRLLAVFDALQWRAHEGQLEGPGVVERYFGTASAAPNAAFNILWRLHVHHLRKLTRQGDKGRGAAAAIERRITEICALFGQTEDMRTKRTPPHFPRVLDLQAQGRFALGFYQQKAADSAAIKTNTEKNQLQNNQQ
jgi:CRISPR-associated protein Csd1